MINRSKSKRLRRKERRQLQKKTRIQIPTPGSAKQWIKQGDSSEHEEHELRRRRNTSSPLRTPFPRPQSPVSCKKSFLDLPEEIRINIYQFLQRPPQLALKFNNSRHSSRRVRCVSSTEYPMLETCSIIRKEYLTHLLSVTHLTLADGIRPRVRHDPRQHGFPLWQLCRIQHVSVDTSYKMQFDDFKRLKTLTLIWPGETLEVQASAAWKKDSRGFLWSEEGKVAIVVFGRAQLLESKENWVQKLAKGKKKRFQLQMRVVFWLERSSRDQGEQSCCESLSLTVSTMDADTRIESGH